MRQTMIMLIPPSLSITLLYIVYVLISMCISIMCSTLYIMPRPNIKNILPEKKTKINIINY